MQALTPTVLAKLPISCIETNMCTPSHPMREFYLPSPELERSKPQDAASTAIIQYPAPASNFLQPRAAPKHRAQEKM